MANELLSIICPVYNTEQYVEKCIDSVLNQKYQNFELMLIDDGSTDNSLKILNNYAAVDERVKVIHTSNGGASRARNIGIKQAKGKYITFIDSDDYVEEDIYSDSINVLKTKNVQMSVCNWRRVKADGNFEEIDISDQCGNISSKELQNILVIKDFDYGACFSVNRVIDNDYLKAKIGDNLYFNETLKIYEDRDYVVRALSFIDVVNIRNKIGYNYLIREDSMCHSFNKEYYVNCIIGWQAVRDDLGDRITPEAFERYNRKIAKNIWCLYRNKECDLAKKYWDIYKNKLVFKKKNDASRLIKSIILNINSLIH